MSKAECFSFEIRSKSRRSALSTIIQYYPGSSNYENYEGGEKFGEEAIKLSLFLDDIICI